ncbi:hypothetical protein C8J56DRAFT_1061832 [Mycena floridula]|nr:hypothetical protein C8J56DRAFT_1061832 [Mycena floridula]
MIVESLWRQLKQRDLPQFNRPWLDLVTHVILTTLFPRIRNTLNYVLGLKWNGRPQALASWQAAFLKDWKAKGRAEKLAQIEEEKLRPQGKYHTNHEAWTCSCPAYLISRFLLCKHLVRAVNLKLQDSPPLQDRRFFLNLRRNYFSPFYSLPGIHEAVEQESDKDECEEVEILILGGSEENSPRETKSNSASVMVEHPSIDQSLLQTLATSSSVEQEEDFNLEEAAVDRVFYSQARIQSLKRCFDEMLETAGAPGSVHPKMAKILDWVFTQVEQVVFCLGSDGSHQEGNTAKADHLAVAQKLDIKYSMGKTLEGHGLKVFMINSKDIDTLWGAISIIITYDGPAAVITKRKMGLTHGHDIIPVKGANPTIRCPISEIPW